MTEKCLDKRARKQTNAQTQAKQLKKWMVESMGRRSPPKQQSNENNAKGNVD